MSGGDTFTPLHTRRTRFPTFLFAFLMATPLLAQFGTVGSAWTRAWYAAKPLPIMVVRKQT
jgi:hypothetical protein